MVPGTGSFSPRRHCLSQRETASHRQANRRIVGAFAPSISTLFARGIELARRVAGGQGPRGGRRDRFRIARANWRSCATALKVSSRKKSSPIENDKRQTAHGASEELRRELVALGREAGLLSPHGPKEYGGLGLDHRGMAVVFEAAGWSTLGPLALNIQAPDEGNVNLLNQIATPEQKARWLAPLVRGEIRSVFSMTETVTDGAGSDPSLLQTTAQQVADGFRDQRPQVDDHRRARGKHQHRHGAHARCRRTRSGRDDVPRRHGRAGFSRRPRAGNDRHQFAGRPRRSLVRQRACDARSRARRDRPRLPQRAGAARTGAPDPLHALARRGAAMPRHRRRACRAAAFVRPHASASIKASASCSPTTRSICTCRALAIWHAAWLLDQHEHARDETSMSKVFCSEALGRVVDRSLQILGSIGITRDTVVERIYRDIRPIPNL